MARPALLRGRGRHWHWGSGGVGARTVLRVLQVVVMVRRRLLLLSVLLLRSVSHATASPLHVLLLRMLLRGATADGRAHREGFGLASVGPAGVEQQRLVLVVLLEQAGVLEARDHGLLALDAGEGHGAYLLAVEALPALPVEGVHEGRDVLRVQEVDEAVAHVAAVLEVDGQVEEVVRALVTHVHLLEQHLLVVLVRDVAHLQ